MKADRDRPQRQANSTRPESSTLRVYDSARRRTKLCARPRSSPDAPIDTGIAGGVDTKVEAVDSKVTTTIQSR